MKLEASLRGFDADKLLSPVIGMRINVAERKSEVPFHSHRQGQLILALRGGVTCQVPNATWMVPSGCAFWVPGNVRHSVRATSNAQICYLFIQPHIGSLPSSCCTIAISRLVQELAIDVANARDDYKPDSAMGRKVGVLIEELETMPVKHFFLPTSEEPRIQKISAILFDNPSDRRTIAEWARLIAMSERSLARLIKHETGMTFGRWRQQLHLLIAMRELSSGRNVQNVAGQLGYESVTAFICMFKKAVGTSPGKYFANIA